MMSGVRAFKLRNANGQEYDMTRPEALLWRPDGLGWGLVPTTTPAGHGYIVTKTDLKQPRVSGTMVFRDYSEYNNFLRLAQVGGLVLCYRPLDIWVYLDCTMEIGKSEINQDTAHLECPVIFYGCSQWYEAIIARETIPAAVEGAKRYPYRYPYRYGGTQAGEVTIQNGVLSSYAKITIIGPATNPSYTLTQNGVRLADGKINVVIPFGHRLVIDANPASMQIAEYTELGAFVADRTQSSDFDTTRYLDIPPGESKITFAQDGVDPVTAYVEVRRRV